MYYAYTILSLNALLSLLPYNCFRSKNNLFNFRVKIYHGAIVCKETKIRGDVTIGSMTIVHPCAKILAEAGPIVIGDGNIIEEQVVIINQ